jgi:CHAT domain-containing protein/tetratricopeptide (TPR) repeat protein
MKSLKIILFFIILNFHNYAFSQEDNIINKCDEFHETSLYYFFEEEDISKAKEFELKAIEQWNKAKIPHDMKYANYINFLSMYYMLDNDYNKSLSLLLSNYSIMQKFQENDPDLIAYYVSLGRCYYNLGKYKNAENYFIKASSNYFSQEEPDSMYYAKLLANIAECKEKVGEYAESILYYDKSIETIENNNNNIDLDVYSFALHGIAWCYYCIDRNREAIKYGERALAIRKQMGEESNKYANQLLDLSSCYLKENMVNKSIEYGEKAKQIYYVLNGKNDFYATALHTLAQCYYKIKKDSIADKYAIEAYEIRKRKLDESHPELASSLLDMSYIYMRNNEDEKSLECLKRASNILNNNGSWLNKQLFINMETVIVSMAVKNKFNELLPFVNEYVINVKKSIKNNYRNFSFINRNYYWQYYNDILLDVFYVSTCIQLKNNPEAAKIAYNIALLSKGCLLTSQREIENNIRNNPDTELRKKLQLLNDLRDKYNKVDELLSKDSLLARIEILEREIVLAASNNNSFKFSIEYSWEDIQEELSENDVAIEFFNSKTTYYALLVRKGWTEPKCIELFNNKITDNIIDSLSRNGKLYKNESRLPYILTFNKIEQYLNNGDRIYFSPSGILHKINLEWLTDSIGNSLNNKYEFHRLLSTRLLKSKEKDVTNPKIVLYGNLKYSVDPEEMIIRSNSYKNILDSIYNDVTIRAGWHELPETKQEIYDINKLFQENKIQTRIYENSDGNEESFKNLPIDKYTIIHLATHGFFIDNYNKNQKLTDSYNFSLNNSGIILSGAQTAWANDSIPLGIEDGVLLSEEISSMDLSTVDLVVLSACETALGNINNDGVWGLQRAFKLAGVNSLIMSLWKVDDFSTRILMCEFYKNYLRGKSKSESLLEAQRFVKDYEDEDGNKIFEDPYFWAGFILLDDIE